MTIRKLISMALCGVLMFSSIPTALAQSTEVDVSTMTPAFYKPYTNQWLYFGWENQDHKSLSTMGGTLYSGGANPGKGVRFETWDEAQNKFVTYDRKAKPIIYTVTVGGVEYVPDETSPNRRENTLWYQADGYMNSPVCEWKAGNTGVGVKIQHVVNQVHVNRTNKDVGVTFSQVSLTNNAPVEQTVVLNVSARSMYEVPLNGLTPDHEAVTKELSSSEMEEGYALYLATIPAGQTKTFDFAATVVGHPRPDDMKAMGSFDDNYAAVKEYYDNLLDGMALPTSLPDEEMRNSYINSMIVMWETMNKTTWNASWQVGASKLDNPLTYDYLGMTQEEYKAYITDIYNTYNGVADYAIHGSASTQAKAVNNPNNFMHGYDMYFPHDVPNMVEQFIRDGRLELAIRIMDSPNYQTLYLPPKHGGNLDAIPKYIIPYAALWQAMNEEQRAAYFTDKVKAQIKHVAEVEVPNYIIPEGEEYAGLIQKSESLDNMPYDYLITDNFTALHGLASYKYLCEAWGWTENAAWANETMTDLNTALNQCMDDFMERNNTEWYMCAMNDDSGFWQRHKNGSVVYDGNFICSSLMMSTFPWDAVLRGYDLGGTWADYFDTSLDNAMYLKQNFTDIPDGSWGAWWGHEYGTVYNVGQCIPMLYSEKYRTKVVEAYEWLMDNQGAPYQWAESFDPGQNANDWTTAAIDYETWGLSFLRQGLLEATASVKTDGTVIVGRGIPNEWLLAEKPIAWQNIQINDGRKFATLKLYAPDTNTVKLELTGDDAVGNIEFNLPVFVDNIAATSVGTVDNATGRVFLPANTKEVTVTLKEAISVDEEIAVPEKVKATADGQDIAVTWEAVENAQSYEVKITADGELMTNETVAIPSYTLKNAIPGLTYSFEVKAVGQYTESEYSGFVTAKVEAATGDPSGEGSITVGSADIAANSNHNLTESGKLDWFKTGYGTRGQDDVVDRKKQDTPYLNRFYYPAVSNNDILLNAANDHPYTVSWTDGTLQETLAPSKQTSLNMGANFGKADMTGPVTVWRVTAPVTDPNGNKLILDIGSWQANWHLNIYLSDNSAAMQTLSYTASNPSQFKRLTIDYAAPKDSNAYLVVDAVFDSKAHQAGNIILVAAALQGDPVELDGITVKAPDKVEYMVGDKLNLDGMQVLANYTYGADKEVGGYRVEGFDADKPGKQTLTVTYTEGENTQTATFDITVVQPILSSLSVSPPAKTEYALNEPFEHSGMSVTAHYENRSDRGITDFILTGYDTSVPGKQTVTVSYTEYGVTKTATFDITVAAGLTLGDVDENGDVNAADALLALQIATQKVTPSDTQTKAADVDGGTGVTANDALVILQYATKKISQFPAAVR